MGGIPFKMKSQHQSLNTRLVYAKVERSLHLILIWQERYLVINCEEKEEFKLAFEIELNQKSKERVFGIFNKYIDSSYFNHAIFVSDKMPLLDVYQAYLLNNFESSELEKFIFVYEPKLVSGFSSILNSKSIYKGEESNLKNIFKV